MTDEMMSLRALLEKSSDADLLREMIGFTAQRLMELEFAGLIETAAATNLRSRCGNTPPIHSRRAADRLDAAHRPSDHRTAAGRLKFMGQRNGRLKFCRLA